MCGQRDKSIRTRQRAEYFSPLVCLKALSACGGSEKASVGAALRAADRLSCPLLWCPGLAALPLQAWRAGRWLCLVKASLPSSLVCFFLCLLSLPQLHPVYGEESKGLLGTFITTTHQLFSLPAVHLLGGSPLSPILPTGLSQVLSQ